MRYRIFNVFFFYHSNQYYNSLSSRIVSNLRIDTFHDISMEQAFMSAVFLPVSYTHLDVYKRQVHEQ